MHAVSACSKKADFPLQMKVLSSGCRSIEDCDSVEASSNIDKENCQTSWFHEHDTHWIAVGGMQVTLEETLDLLCHKLPFPNSDISYFLVMSIHFALMSSKTLMILENSHSNEAFPIIRAPASF